MKFSTLFNLVVAIVFLCLITISATAQANVSGYTSINYDETTNTLTAYSETDSDYSLVGEYRAYVGLTVRKSSGVLAAYGSANDTHGNGFASVVLNFAGEPDTTYTAVGNHRIFAELWDYADTYPYQRFYYDDWYFTQFESQGIYVPWSYDFTSPGYYFYRRPNDIIYLGSTYDSDSTTTPPACGDERDTIIKEYKTYGVSLKPTCSFFTQIRGSANFPFSDLNTGDYSWGLIRDPLTTNAIQFGLVEWQSQYGGSMIVNSAYRNPSRNNRIPGSAKQSRHMYGDAVDIRNETRTINEYNQRADAARRSRADYIEPWTGPCGNGCVHADWRNHSGEYNY